MTFEFAVSNLLSACPPPPPPCAPRSCFLEGFDYYFLPYFYFAGFAETSILIDATFFVVVAIGSYLSFFW